jgi:hypothetical protein
MGWIVAIFVVIALAWTVAIGYEFARPGKLNWNQPSWLIPRRRAGTGPPPPVERSGPQAGDPGPRVPPGEDHRAGS